MALDEDGVDILSRHSDDEDTHLRGGSRSLPRPRNESSNLGPTIAVGLGGFDCRVKVVPREEDGDGVANTGDGSDAILGYEFSHCGSEVSEFLLIGVSERRDDPPNVQGFSERKAREIGEESLR